MSTEDSESTDKTEHAQSTENAEAAGPVGRGRTADTPGRVALTRSERLRSQGSRGRPAALLRGLLTLIVVLAIIAIVRTLFVQSYTIPSGSMEDTLHAGDRILVTLYDTDSVQHGDVVVFTDPDHWLTDPEPTGAARFAQDVLVFLRILPQDAGHHLVKRVVGLPGDHIVADGSGPVSVNGVVLDEPYLKPGRTSSDIAFDVTVPDGYVWVMGGQSFELGGFPTASGRCARRVRSSRGYRRHCEVRLLAHRALVRSRGRSGRVLAGAAGCFRADCRARSDRR